MHINTACPVAQVNPYKGVLVERANLNAVCLLSHKNLNAFRFYNLQKGKWFTPQKKTFFYWKHLIFFTFPVLYSATNKLSLESTHKSNGICKPQSSMQRRK